MWTDMFQWLRIKIRKTWGLPLIIFLHLLNWRQWHHLCQRISSRDISEEKVIRAMRWNNTPTMEPKSRRGTERLLSTSPTERVHCSSFRFNNQSRRLQWNDRWKIYCTFTVLLCKCEYISDPWKKKLHSLDVWMEFLLILMHIRMFLHCQKGNDRIWARVKIALQNSFHLLAKNRHQYSFSNFLFNSCFIGYSMDWCITVPFDFSYEIWPVALQRVIHYHW